MKIPILKKLKIEKDIRKLNANFDPEAFKELFRKIYRLHFIVLTSEIEAWLNELNNQENLPIISGILS